MGDSNTPSRVNWFLLGTAFGLVAWPFYSVLLGLDGGGRKKLRA